MYIIDQIDFYYGR